MPFRNGRQLRAAVIAPVARTSRCKSNIGCCDTYVHTYVRNVAYSVASLFIAIACAGRPGVRKLSFALRSENLEKISSLRGEIALVYCYLCVLRIPELTCDDGTLDVSYIYAVWCAKILRYLKYNIKHEDILSVGRPLEGRHRLAMNKIALRDIDIKSTI